MRDGHECTENARFAEVTPVGGIGAYFRVGQEFDVDDRHGCAEGL